MPRRPALFWPIVLLWSSVAAADAAPPTPLSLLTRQHLISSSSFILSHATYAQYHLHWVRPPTDMTALFGTDAETRAQATQVRWIDLTVPLTTSGHLTSAAALALMQASTTLAAGCLSLHLPHLKAQIAEALAKAKRVRVAEVDFGPTLQIDVVPTDAALTDDRQRREITVLMHLPAGQPPLCQTVPE